MNYKYFNLNPECYFTMGVTRGVIQNLLTKDIIWLDEQNSKSILKSEKGEIIEVKDDFFNELGKMGWGFFSEHKYYIDKLRSMNAFNQKKYWKDTPIIYSAVLQLVNECNLNCDFCKEIFCPSCTKITRVDNHFKVMSLDTWISIIDELYYFGMRHLVLTGGEVTLFKDLLKLITYAQSKGIYVNVNTNGLIPINNLPIEVEIYINLYNRDQIDTVLSNYLKHDKVTLVCINDLCIDDIIDGLNPNWKIQKGYNNSPEINADSIIKTDLQMFFLKKTGNICLKSRIYICYNADVIPCFGKKDIVVGNVQTTGLSKALQILSTEFWEKVMFEDETNGKCKKCEFKYSCGACNFVNVDEQCTYNLEDGVWI
ncbi:radical SAM/SPASM domain-containing protein [Clostridium estertheticum]|uniref:radical SAM/SPASM domain-containing protein n=1 Tax=Clostridium estertheticum TaxID=238834 RepID=UPI001CF20C93|nr:radical SAM protein [Clostridium estertheticum]MCB2362190.1 radical SAM protein [Clostridium estertheticum]